MNATDDAIAGLASSITTLSGQVQAVAAEVASLQAGQGATAEQLNELASLTTQVQGLSNVLTAASASAASAPVDGMAASPAAAS